MQGNKFGNGIAQAKRPPAFVIGKTQRVYELSANRTYFGFPVSRSPGPDSYNVRKELEKSVSIGRQDRRNEIF
jgi:hypothetical protein